MKRLKKSAAEPAWSLYSGVKGLFLCLINDCLHEPYCSRCWEFSTEPIKALPSQSSHIIEGRGNNQINHMPCGGDKCIEKNKAIKGMEREEIDHFYREG